MVLRRIDLIIIISLLYVGLTNIYGLNSSKYKEYLGERKLYFSGHGKKYVEIKHPNISNILNIDSLLLEDINIQNEDIIFIPKKERDNVYWYNVYKYYYKEEEIIDSCEWDIVPKHYYCKCLLMHVKYISPLSKSGNIQFIIYKKGCKA